MSYRTAEEILEVIMDEDSPEENLHFLRQHLLLAAQRACTLALQWGDEEGNPDPKMASRAGKIWDLAEDICPPEEDWGGENVIRFPYEKVRAG